MVFPGVEAGTCHGVGMVTSGAGAGRAAGSHRSDCQTFESAVGGCAG